MTIKLAFGCSIVGVLVGIFGPFPPLLGGAIIVVFGAGPLVAWFLSVIAQGLQPGSPHTCADRKVPDAFVYFFGEDEEG